MPPRKGCCARLRRRRVRLYEYKIYANDIEKNRKFKYPSNELTTTKYTLYSFFPRFLYEQFRRLPNLYFLLVSIITCIPGVSPISPVSAVLPFVLIILTAAVKEAFEDFKRWQSDLEINNRVFKVLRGNKFEDVKNKHIRVGDIIRLEENQEVPADTVILSTSDKEGVCYVDTANLDGETTLKQFKALPATCQWTEDQIKETHLVITAGLPIEKLTEFRGNMDLSYIPETPSPAPLPPPTLLENQSNSEHSDENMEQLEVEDFEEESEEDNKLPLNIKQLLLRGVRVRNTHFVYGVVVYAGKQTKLALNAVQPPSKFSVTERAINWVALGIFSLKILLVIGCTIGSLKAEAHDIWYAPLTDHSLDAGTVFMSYFVLLGYFIPISLFVNLEVLKLGQAGWMMGDNDMTKDNMSMRVKNSNLNDELSRVSYVFSDKTGTLTQNKMIFDQCTIDGKKYPDAGAGGLKELVGKDENVREFLLNMVLNNEVLAEEKVPEQPLLKADSKKKRKRRKSTNRSKDKYVVTLDSSSHPEIPKTVVPSDGMPKYAAPSPDEIALVKGAYVNGIQFRTRTNDGIAVTFDTLEGRPSSTFRILNVMEFSSERKRSSVIIATPEGKIILYSKGADSAMKPRLVEGTDIPRIEKNLSEYSKVGLRTLLFCKKELSLEQYKVFEKKYNAAAASIENREQQLAVINNEMETNLTLQGCSAIQDALQDQVPFTIAYLIQAGIKVWMITGDQQDTAENIGYSCQLITKSSRVVRVVKCENTEKCSEALLEAKRIVETEQNVSLVVDGHSLVYALTEHEKLLLEVGKQCATVIVCRADPLQKALVVRLIKRGTGKITLSIGDGANDVSMLQEAHIGVGIWGEEGTQAAQNADYAIRLFKHLAKLVTVHGRYNMMRTAIMVEYSFYKNMALFACQFWFALYNRWSAQTFFDDWVMAAYNTVICSLPPLSLAFFEKDLLEEYIMKYPQTYRELRRGLYFTKTTFARWIFAAIYHSLIIFFSSLFIPDAVQADGKTAGLFFISTAAATAGISSIILKALLSTRHWVLPSVISYALSFIALFALFFIESDLPGMFANFYHVMHTVTGTGYFWFTLLIVCAICMVPEVCFEFVQRTYFPKDWQIIQELVHLMKRYDIPLDSSTFQIPEFERGCCSGNSSTLVVPKTIQQIVDEQNKIAEEYQEKNDEDQQILELSDEKISHSSSVINSESPDSSDSSDS